MEKVVVLMSTYNGEKYLKTQIESLIAQEDVDIEILVRDDGSRDSTLKILEGFKCDDSVKVDVYTGENMGPARSFLDLMKRAPIADYYALCDQDDTWLPDKLKIAVDAIKKESYRNKEPDKLRESIDREVPILYYGMPRFSDNEGKLLDGPKGIYESSLDFPSCLIKSNSTGCTMVFNRKLLEIINSKTPGPITMHDEWLHKVCLALGGKIIYDEDVHILYRQHGNNTIGGQLGLRKILKRYINTLIHPDCIRSRCISTLLECYGEEMSDENRRMSMELAGYKKSIKNKIRVLVDGEIKTKYVKRNILFRAAVLLGIF